MYLQIINPYVPNVRIISSTLVVYMETIQYIRDTRTLQESRFISTWKSICEWGQVNKYMEI